MPGDLYGTTSCKRVDAIYGSSHAHATVQSQVLAVHVSGILVKKGLQKRSLSDCIARSKGSLRLICFLGAFSLAFAPCHAAEYFLPGSHEVPVYI
jgi:hypothetical protein